MYVLPRYFESRPHLLGQGESSSIPGGAASVAAVQRTLAANPAATSAIVSAGLKQVPKNSPYGAVASNPKVAGGVGRVAAAAASLSASRTFPFGGGGGQSPTPNASASERTPSPNQHSSPPSPPLSKGPAPQPPIRRIPSSQNTDRITSGVKGIVAQSQGMLSSFRGHDTPPPPPAPPAPPAPPFAPPAPPPAPPRAPVPSSAAKSSFAPPPVRRVAPSPRKEPEPEEEEEQGEWAEALYDYLEGDAGDLKIQAGQRILVVEHSSDDWWTGELNGKRGLFPKSYVKVL